MATITAAVVATRDSLETFRQQFNTLRGDIQGLSFGGSLVFEGTTADDFETTLQITDPTADRTVTIQNKTGILAMQGRDINDVVVMDASDGSGTDEAGALLLNASADGVDAGEALLYESGTSDHIVNPVLQIAGNFVFEGATTDAFETTLSITDPSADRTITLQDKTGTVALQGRDIDDIILLSGTDANGADAGSAIILDGVATAVDGIQSDVGEALLYETGTSDHIVNPIFDDNEEFIILEESSFFNSVFLTRENVDESSANARFAYQTATSDNLLGSLFLVPAAGGVQFTMPVADGNADQLLSTDGAGNLTFANQSDGLSLNNDGNNRVITATGSNTGNGEANLTFTGSALAVTGTVTASGIIKTDDTTAATSTTDGSLQTDGGLSVVLDAVIGDDIIMISDAAQIAFGVNSEITLAHVHNVGLTIEHHTAGDNLPVVLQLKSEEDAVIANEVIASIEFAAGDSDGTDGATVAAGIHAIAEDTFSASVNKTKLVFTTGVSETAASSATAKATLSSIGDFQVAGDLVIKDGGLIGSASDLDAIAIASDGVVTMNQIPVLSAGINVSATTASTSKTTGALTVAGGAGISLDLSIGDDIFMLSDSAVITFGANSEIALTHNHNVGLLMTSTAYAPLARRGEDVFIVLDQTAAAGTDAGDNVIMDRSADSTDVGDDIIGEDEVFLHSGMQRNVLQIFGSGGELLNSVAGFAPGAI